MKTIILIGDSIRQGYDRYTRLAFEDVAKVHYPTDNCQFAAYILRHLSNWKNDFECGEDVDCVHWNAGLWDSIYFPDGEIHTPVEIYKYYIDRVCTRIKQLFPRAKVIFATSTPVREHLFLGELKRFNKDVIAHNEAAKEVVAKHGFIINDLYELTKDIPESYYSDMTHLYTKEGTKLLTDKVVECIENCLDIKAKKLDYDKLFADAENIIGI